MSSTKSRIPLKQAQDLLNKIIAELAPGCEPGRIVAAGSTRRERPTVGDLEIVAIPRYQAMHGATVNFLTGQIPQESVLDAILDSLIEEGRLLLPPGAKEHRQRARQKVFYLPALPDLKLELWLAKPESWGYILAIRTGPGSEGNHLSKHLVTQAHKFGPLPPGYYCDGGFVWRGNRELVQMPEERDFFELCGYQWRPATEREDWKSWERVGQLEEV